MRARWTVKAFRSSDPDKRQVSVMWASKIAGASPLQPVTLLLGVHELLRRSRCTPSGSQFIRVGYHVTLREERSTFTSNEVSLVGLALVEGV